MGLPLAFATIAGLPPEYGLYAAMVPTVIAALFGYQQWKLWRLQSQWAGISGRVKELENVQERIRQFRPWDDRGYTSLTILRQLTTAFPAEGIVNAKSVEIRNGELVTCSPDRPRKMPSTRSARN